MAESEGEWYAHMNGLDCGRRPCATCAPDYFIVACFVCGDPADHSGVPHGQATGDGQTRADVLDRVAMSVDAIGDTDPDTERHRDAAELLREIAARYRSLPD